MILTWILTHGFFQSLSERTIYKSSSTGQRQRGGAGWGITVDARAQLAGEAAPSHLQRENHQLGQELQHVCSAAGLRVCSGVIKFLAKRLSVRWG